MSWYLTFYNERASSGDYVLERAEVGLCRGWDKQAYPHIFSSWVPIPSTGKVYNAVPAGLLKIVKYSSECSGDAN